MSYRASAMIWLVLGLFSGLITLVILCGGGSYLWHTHSTVEKIDKRINEDKAEADRLRIRALNQDELKRLQELNKRLDDATEYNEAQKYRAWALGGVVTFVIPALMTLAFLIMFLVKWLKARKADKPAAEEDDEEESEEEPPAPTKAKKKQAAENDEAD